MAVVLRCKTLKVPEETLLGEGFCLSFSVYRMLILGLERRADMFILSKLGWLDKFADWGTSSVPCVKSL